MESNSEKIYESITIRWFWMDDRNPGGKVKRRDSKLDPNEICVLNIGNDKQISFKRIEFKIKISKWISIWYILNDVNSLFFFQFFFYFPGANKHCLFTNSGCCWEWKLREKKSSTFKSRAGIFQMILRYLNVIFPLTPPSLFHPIIISIFTKKNIKNSLF